MKLKKIEKENITPVKKQLKEIIQEIKKANNTILDTPSNIKRIIQDELSTIINDIHDIHINIHEKPTHYNGIHVKIEKKTTITETKDILLPMSKENQKFVEIIKNTLQLKTIQTEIIQKSGYNIHSYTLFVSFSLYS